MSEPVARPTEDGGYVVGDYDPTPEAHHTMDADGDGKPDYTPQERLEIGRYAKAIAAFVVPALTLAVSYITAGSDGGEQITTSEWLSMILACLSTAGVVYAVPNKLPPR